MRQVRQNVASARNLLCKFTACTNGLSYFFFFKGKLISLSTPMSDLEVEFVWSKLSSFLRVLEGLIIALICAERRRLIPTSRFRQGQLSMRSAALEKYWSALCTYKSRRLSRSTAFCILHAENYELRS